MSISQFPAAPFKNETTQLWFFFVCLCSHCSTRCNKIIYSYRTLRDIICESGIMASRNTSIQAQRTQQREHNPKVFPTAIQVNVEQEIAHKRKMCDALFANIQQRTRSRTHALDRGSWRCESASKTILNACTHDCFLHIRIVDATTVFAVCFTRSPYKTVFFCRFLVKKPYQTRCYITHSLSFHFAPCTH